MMLKLENLTASYQQIRVLREISLHVNKGEVVSLLGANGAGKTTLLKTITGGVTVNSGQIMFEDNLITKMPTHKIVRLKIAHVPENRRVFRNLSVKDNLVLGGYQFLKGEEIERQIKTVYEYFPRLEERKGQLAGTLSGGEQQMLAIGRALMMKPKLIILDEPSQGLAPLIIKEIFRVIQELSRTGLTILLVEQNIYQALHISNRGYVIKNGSIIMEGSASELLSNESIQEAYL
jgi:branched-chain amino acid transport system ATP-binding protein